MVNAFEDTDPRMVAYNRVNGDVDGLLRELGWTAGLLPQEESVVLTINHSSGDEVARATFHDNGIIVQGFDGTQEQVKLDKSDRAATLVREIMNRRIQQNS